MLPVALLEGGEFQPHSAHATPLPAPSGLTSSRPRPRHSQRYLEADSPIPLGPAARARIARRTADPPADKPCSLLRTASRHSPVGVLGSRTASRKLVAGRPLHADRMATTWPRKAGTRRTRPTMISRTSRAPQGSGTYTNSGTVKRVAATPCSNSASGPGTRQLVVPGGTTTQARGPGVAL
jgi:hypothetical protein